MPTAPMEHLAGIARAAEYHDGAGFPDDHPDGDDCPVDALIDYKNALEEEVARLLPEAEAARRIATGVPRKPDWRSGASFLEGVASILDQHDVSRPDYYADEAAWS